MLVNTSVTTPTRGGVGARRSTSCGPCGTANATTTSVTITTAVLTCWPGVAQKGASIRPRATPRANSAAVTARAVHLDRFGRTLRTSGVVASMGSIGDAFDNAMAESFFATLKEEMIYRRAWPTRHELEMEVFSFVEGFYNPLRRPSRLGNLSPAAYEQQLTTQTEVSG
jgi:hypothetical protein